MNAPRLIQRTDALSQLLAAIAEVPAGEKLPIPRLRDALVSQADVLDGVRILVAAGELDPKTLRPPLRIEKREPVARPDLLERVRGECLRRGLPMRRASEQIFGNGTQLYALRNPRWRPSGAIVAAIEAWLERSGGEPGQPTVAHGAAKLPAAEEAAPMEPFEGPRGTRSGIGDGDSASAPAKSPEERPESAPPPAQLLAEIEAFCERTGMTRSAFGKRVKNDLGYVRRLRTGSIPKARSVEQVRAFIRNWVPEDEPARPARAQRSPNIEVAVRRSITKRAEEFLAGESNGKTKGGAPNQAVLAVARQISDTRAAQARQTDPVEAAKLALQRKGVRPVCSMAVHGGRADLFMVGSRRNVTKEQLLDMAGRG
jgi:hypothetical protein